MLSLSSHRAPAAATSLPAQKHAIVALSSRISTDKRMLTNQRRHLLTHGLLHRTIQLGGLMFITMWLASLSPMSGAATLLVANKSAASVSLYDLPDGREVAELPTGIGPHEVAVAPDGAIAAVSDYGTREQPGSTITLIDIAKAQVIKTIALPTNAKPHGLEWLDQRRLVITAEGIESVLVVDTLSSEVAAPIAIAQDVVHMLALDREAQRVFTANIGSGSASVVELQDEPSVRTLNAGKGAEGIALVKDSAELWISNRAEDSVTVFDAESGERLDTLKVTGFPIRIEPDAARNRVYITLPATDQLALIDMDSREIIKLHSFEIEPDLSRKTIFGDRLPNSSVPVGVLLSGDGQQLFVAHSAAHVVSVWNAGDLSPLGTIQTGLEPDGMDWSPVTVDGAQ